MKRGNSKRYSLLTVVVLLLAGAFYGIGDNDADNKTSDTKGQVTAVKDVEKNTVKEETSETEEMEVHFIDVGQADSVLIKTKTEAMLVDAGENGSGDEVVTYLQKQGVEHLDYVIGTHPHEDHIGGLDDVLESFSIGEVILPGKTHTSQTFLEVLEVIKERGLSITPPVTGQIYQLGEASFTILSPEQGADYGDELNNWSVCIRLEHGENSFMLTGDAESPVETQILYSGLEVEADVWKAGHHGSDTSNSAAILREVNPTYTVISCGVGNSYGHPHDEVLQRFEDMGILYFRTDTQGTIIATSDGKDIYWNQKPVNE